MSHQVVDVEPPGASQSSLAGKRRLLTASVVGVVTFLVALLIVPSPASLADADGSTGDVDLARSVRQAAGDAGLRGVAVAMVGRDGDVVFAGLGDSGNPDRPEVDQDTLFEIGSISKALTGMLAADLVGSGDLKLDTTLREIYPGRQFDDPAVAALTLEELLTHTSGLPKLPMNPQLMLRASLSQVAGISPYSETPADILDAMGNASVDGDKRGKVNYSNLGMAIAAHAIATVQQSTYPRLLRERVLQPLGMKATFISGTDQLPADRARGTKANGAHMDDWDSAGYAPAVGVWSTSADIAKLLRAVMDGSAPGASATKPRKEDGDSTVGLAWFTGVGDHDDVIWHNGGTGGFRSFTGFDTEAGEGVVVLGNTDTDVDDIAVELLTGDEATDLVVPWLGLGIVAFLLFAAIVAAKLKDRSQLIIEIASGTALLALAWRIGPWGWLPPLVWAFSAAVAVAFWSLRLRRWNELPWHVKGGWWRPSLRIAGAAGSLAVAATVVATVL